MKILPNILLIFIFTLFDASAQFMNNNGARIFTNQTSVIVLDGIELVNQNNGIIDIQQSSIFRVKADATNELGLIRSQDDAQIIFEQELTNQDDLDIADLSFVYVWLNCINSGTIDNRNRLTIGN